MYRDVVEIVEEAGDKVDTLLVPKAGTASDVYMVDCLLTQIEENKKKPKTEGRFQRRLRKLQEAAEKAQKLQNQRNK